MSSPISNDTIFKFDNLVLDDSGVQLTESPALADRVNALFQEIFSTISTPSAFRANLRDDIESFFDQIEKLRDDEESTEIVTTYDNLTDLYNILEYPYSRDPINLPLRIDQLVLAVLTGSYSVEIDEEKALGVGSYASVYRGTLCKELSAVKCRNTGERRNEQSAHHHEREYQALIALKDHPHIIKLLAANNCELFLEFAEGGSLEKPKEPLNAIQLSVVLSQSADAIAYMHEKGFIHRDIHLGNILLTRNNEARLSDFGTAITPEKFAKTATPEGTIRYMSPEHLLGTATPENCQKMDTWSFGIMIWDLLSKNSLKTPYEDALDFENDFQLAIQLQNHFKKFEGFKPGSLESQLDPKKVIEYDPSGRLTSLMTRCLTLNPENRPSMGAVRDFLNAPALPIARSTPSRFTVTSTPAPKPSRFTVTTVASEDPTPAPTSSRFTVTSSKN